MIKLSNKKFKDNRINYVMIGGYPTSLFGVTLAKRCKWCYNTINPILQSKENRFFDKTNKQGIMSKTFCCDDCRDEFRDWSYINSYRRKLMCSRNNRRLGNKNNESFPISKNDRKEYLRIYYKQNRKRKNAQAVMAMRRYRAKKLLD